MTVFILLRQRWDNVHLIGVYDSLEKARAGPPDLPPGRGWRPPDAAVPYWYTSSEDWDYLVYEREVQ